MNDVCRVDYFEGKQVMFSITQYGLYLKRNWLLSIFAIALGMLHTSSMAQQCNSSGGTISTAVTTQCALTSGTLTITETGSISTTGIPAVLINNNVTAVNNSGTVSASSAIAFRVFGTLGTLTNSASITSGNQTIYINSGGEITSLANFGTISSSISNTISNNSGTIGALTNAGSITSSLYAAIANDGAINTLTNSGGGIISSSSSNAIYNSSGRTIGTLTNDGLITSAGAVSALTNYGTITNLTNRATGTIQNTGSGRAMVNNPGATIGILNNAGTISAGTSGLSLVNAGTINALINSGTIAALDNRQGASSYALSYSGTLPTTYRIIIASTTNYGKLSVTNPGQSILTFGIFSNTSVSTVPASTLVAGTYSSVLTGLTSSNIASSSLSGTYTGGYAWQLVNASGSTSIWDLVVSPTNSISANVTTGLSNVGVTSAPILAGGTLTLNNANSSSTAFSVTSTSTIQSPTTGTATLSGVFSGAGSLNFTGTGTTVLSGVNTYTGGTTVSSGTLQGNTTSIQGAITNNGKVVFDQPSTGTFSGTIAGSGSVVVQNSGAVVLTGANTYSGGTTVSGGTLSVAGTAPTGTGDVVISSPGTLMGTGTIAGNGIVSGVIKPGNSPGYLTFAQNLTLNAGSTYQQDIAGTVQASSTSPVGATGYYSFVNVGGQLIINSGATLAPMLQNLFQTTESGYGSAPYVPKLGDTFRIATAAGGITGTFSSVTQPTGLSSGTQFIPFYNYGGSNSLDLAVIPTSYSSTLASSNANAQSVAAVLDKLSAAQISGSASTNQSNLMYSTATQTASSLAGFAQSLAGEVYADTLAVIPQTSQRVQSVVMNRLSDTAIPVVAGNPNNNIPINSGINSQIPLGVQGNHMGNHSEVNSSQGFIAAPNNSVWGEIAYQNGNRTTDSNANGFNSNLYQTVFGAEIYNENNIKAGTGFSLSTTNVSMSSGSGTVRQGSLFVYGKMPVIKDYVLDGMASVGLSSTDVSRNDPTARTSLEGKGIKGNDVLLSTGISRPFDTEDVTISPYIRSTWQMVNQSSFDEGTTSAASLSVNGYSGNGVRGLIGVSVGAKNKDPMVDEYTYKANIAVGADSNTLINPSLQANLASYGTTIQTANVGSGLVQAGLYGTVKFTNNGFAYAGIAGEARNGQTLGSVNLGARLQF